MSNTITIKPIRTKADHAAALAEIESLWDAKPRTPEHDKLEVLATLVDAYERAHTPILPPDPIEAIKFRMEQQGKTRKDLEPILGTRARISEILRGHRSLTLPMIRGLHHALAIPYDVLLVTEDNYVVATMKPPRASDQKASHPYNKKASPRATGKEAASSQRGKAAAAKKHERAG